MRGAWIGEASDVNAFQVAARNSGRPTWEIERVERNFVYMENSADKILQAGYDFIVLPLSLPGYWSFRLAARANHLASPTRLLLWSRTDADPMALRALFDGVFTRDSLLTEILHRAEKPTTREREPKVWNELVARIVTTASALRASYQERIPTPAEVRDFEFTPEESAQPRPLTPPGGPTSMPVPKLIPWPRSRGVSYPPVSHPAISLDGTEVFLAYVQQDLRFASRLQVHFRALYPGKTILWTDRRIPPGDDYLHELNSALDVAKVAVVLVSADFLAAEFVAAVQLPRLLALRAAGGFVVIPIITAPCLYEQIPGFGSLKPFNSCDKPLSAMRRTEAEEVLRSAAEHVGHILGSRNVRTL
jgi:hypothetical protein